MKRIRRFIVFTLLATPLGSVAQSPLSVGERVRVRYPNGAVLIGNVQFASADSLSVKARDGGIAVPVTAGAITLVERSLGMHRRFDRNFGRTIVASTLVVGAIAALSWSHRGGFAGTRGEEFLFGAALGAAIGVPLGIIVGGVVKTESWERIPLAAKSIAPFVGPVGGRAFGLRATVVF